MNTENNKNTNGNKNNGNRTSYHYQTFTMYQEVLKLLTFYTYFSISLKSSKSYEK